MVGSSPLRADNGDIVVNFATGHLVFSISEKTKVNEQKACAVLTVRGPWRTHLPMAARAKMLEICDQWNKLQLWPKAYVYTDNKGRLWMCCEHSTDITNGVSDDQLNDFLYRAIGTCKGFFEMLEETFPDARFNTPA